MKTLTTFSSDVQTVFEDQDTYINFSQLLIDAANDSVREFSAAEANDKIREMFHKIQGTNSNSNRKELRRAIRQHKYDIFELIEDTVENRLVTGWGENPFFREFVEMKSVASGDTNEFTTEDKSVLTVSEVSGNHHDLERQSLGFGETFRVKTSWIGLKVYTEYENFMAGRIDWVKMINKVYEAVDAYVNGVLYGAVIGGADKLSSQFNKTGTLTKAGIIEWVSDVQTATNAEVALMGTKAALSKVTALGDTSWISNEMKDELNKTGRVGYFEGIRLVEIPQAFAKNDTTTKLVSNNILLAMPLTDNKFIKMFDEGEAQISEVSDGNVNRDKTVEFEYQMKLGVATVISTYFGKWTTA